MANLSELMGGGGGSGVIDQQQFDTSGTWTKPDGVEDWDVVEVEMWAAGGGGCKYAGSNYYAWGGSPGAYARIRFFARDLEASETVQVGAGGAAGTYVAGSTGGITSFGPLVMNGGAGGSYNNGYIANVESASQAYFQSASSQKLRRMVEFVDAYFSSSEQTSFVFCGGGPGYVTGSGSYNGQKETMFGGQAGDTVVNNTTRVGTRGTTNGETPGGGGGASFGNENAGKGGDGRVIIRVLKGGV
ncbi:hypothetical protein GCM10007989_04880 [Devosia pacifica]|uniref:Glycine-rich domain-containing protein n=1 Tax=Devosia pacifica TaxID=1335967 RepID=A0A918VNW4_9HYPH|nr:hypothetical protein [Devosia pacifica]GHA13314.1 hypothetical protein GCM10007989_04880 [Devosia pacifica]